MPDTPDFTPNSPSEQNEIREQYIKNLRELNLRILQLLAALELSKNQPILPDPVKGLIVYCLEIGIHKALGWKMAEITQLYEILTSKDAKDE